MRLRLAPPAWARVFITAWQFLVEGCCCGLDTFVSHAYGREDLDDARHSLTNGLFLAFLLTPLLMMAVSLWPMMMARFGISPELVEPMRPFLRALNWGTLPLLAYFALRRYLQAVNVALPIMFALISANIVNAVGDWALIYGHLGFRAMGITGSGWSTCFARVYMAGVLAITLCWVEWKRRKALTKPARTIRIDLHRMWALLKLGTPAATQILCEIGAFSAATALIAKLGAVPLSGHEIALNCAALTFMVPLGISSAAAVRVGQQLGRKDPAGARRAGWSAITLGSIIHDLLGPRIRIDPNRHCPAVFPGSTGDSDRSETFAGGRGIPVVRWITDGHYRGAAGSGGHQNSHARQFHRLLADRSSGGLCAVLQIWVGRVGYLVRIVRRVDHYRVGAFAHLESKKTCRVSWTTGYICAWL